MLGRSAEHRDAFDYDSPNRREVPGEELNILGELRPATRVATAAIGQRFLVRDALSTHNDIRRIRVGPTQAIGIVRTVN